MKKHKYENICLYCGKKFSTNRKKIVTCSTSCSVLRKREQDKIYWKQYYVLNKEKILQKNRKWWKLHYQNR